MLVWAVVTAAGCLLSLLAAGRVWATAGKGGSVVTATGGDLNGGLTTMALTGLAGVVAVIATKGAGRRVIGALLALVGAGLVWAAYAGAADTSVKAWLSTQNVLGGTWEGSSLWPALCMAGGVIMLAGGVAAVVRGGHWAAMSARYDRAPAKERPADDRSMWDALDRGDDPT